MGKLELKYVLPYIPYNLEAEMLDYKSDYVGKKYDELIGLHQWDKLGEHWCLLTKGGSKPSIDRVKPILRPLIEYKNYEDILDEFSEWSEEQFENAFFVLGGCLNKSDSINYTVMELMFKYKLDIFGLIDKDLAVDINSLKS